MKPIFPNIISLAAISLALFSPISSGAAEEVKLTNDQAKGKVRVEIGGKLFTEYYYKNVLRPYYYPVIGPSGHTVTRHYPMKSGVKGEASDHLHHRSLWFTHGSVNGQDFWHEGKKSNEKNTESIVHTGFKKIEGGAGKGTIVSQNEWRGKDGKVVLTDTRTCTITALGNGETYVDFEHQLHSSHTDVVWGDTKEGSMAIRLAPTMRLKGGVAKGHIVNSNGDKDGATWGKRAKWCDYYGPDESGSLVGVSIFDHPKNLRFPTWWHVRDYGLFAANPFGIRAFERKNQSGNHTVPKGKTLTQRYRLYFHHGDTAKAGVDKHYDKYSATAGKTE